MTRQNVSLQAPPDDPARLRGFPSSTLEPETELWRVCRVENGPWWFSSSLNGRFDLPEPQGTCYLSTQPLSALLEVLGPDRVEGTVSTEMLAKLRLYSLHPPGTMSLADFTAGQAAGFGITLEIHTCSPYALPQAWARALNAAQADGLLYFARHDPSLNLSVALFGESGERKSWDPGSAHGIEETDVLERLWRDYGIRATPRPRLDQIQVIE